ncbi:MAG TPA: molybdopterin molybdotransferase MoeA, partial [Thermoanaerobaculia bacterium]|nr:molybdopterin molybdotransferase MoeA [Thermoanaerobaculia bacterium]
ARVDVPAMDVSAMDGYAVAGDIPPGERRPVAGTIAAGSPPGFSLVPPAVARIMTGAPVPLDADRVIQVEQSETHGADRSEVSFREPGSPGQHIRRQGEIQRAGSELLPRGALLTPGALSLLATHGYGTLPVHRAPRVAFLTTGDEVVPPESEPAPGQLRDSHTDFLLAAGASLDLSFTPLGHAPDREAALLPLIERGLSSDVLILCGGVSKGEFDLVEGVLAQLGCQAVFDSVAIQPGQPLVFAVHEREGQRGFVFGLPGNPASVMVTFWLFVRPALRCLAGKPDAFWDHALAATTTLPLPAGGPRDRFFPAEIEIREGRIHATPTPFKGSHDLAAYAHGTALLRVRAGAPAAPAGGACEVLGL